MVNMVESDSEYFESADEDILSDEETANKILDGNNKEKSTNILPSTSRISQVIINKEQESLKSIESNDDIEKVISQHTSSISLNLKNMNIKHDVGESHTITDKIELVESDEAVYKGQNKNQDGNSLREFEINKKSNIESNISPREKITTLKENKALNNDEESIKSTMDQCHSDQNLWDDDELDWGTEGKLEDEAKLNLDKKIIENENIVHVQSMASSKPKLLEGKTRSEHQDLNVSQSDTWGGWSSWVLSTATNSVSTITNQLSNVIESGLGAVDPEELAKINKNEQEEDEKLEQECSGPHTYSSSFGLGNLVKFVENTGTKVISGGLDTLETIGKKTMEVLQEGDPGLKKKRALLKIDQDKPVLSQILREAKEKADKEAIDSESYTKKVKNYETLFDDHQGLVHLEALELLSKQCDIKLKNLQSSLTGEQYTEFLETMDQIKELCELPDEDEEEQLSLSEIEEKIHNAVKELGISISYEKLLTFWKETELWLTTLNMDICDVKELHQQAIETLARITSMAMEQFHKIGELLLVKERRSTADEADSLVQITTSLMSLIGAIAAKYSEKLNGQIIHTTNKVSEFITNVFFEAANSSSYIQDACQLLIPVLQVGAL